MLRFPRLKLDASLDSCKLGENKVKPFATSFKKNVSQICVCDFQLGLLPTSGQRYDENQGEDVPRHLLTHF
jgi:hypothetical protein